jgi:hypothetical protein
MPVCEIMLQAIVRCNAPEYVLFFIINPSPFGHSPNSINPSASLVPFKKGDSVAQALCLYNKDCLCITLPLFQGECPKGEGLKLAAAQHKSL